MEELRSIAGQYETPNLYNGNETRLFYRMESRRSYLDGDENHSMDCGTDFMKHKHRETVVLSWNAHGYNILIPCHLGKYITYRCFTDERYSQSGERYWQQTNAWMDIAGFDR